MCLIVAQSIGQPSPFDFTIQVPKYEVRAVWLTTIGGLDWPHNYSRSSESMAKQQKELCLILDKLKDANVNMVMLQTRVRGTLIYPSDLEPWDGCMSGVPGLSPGYDPLQYAIDECHKRGMELHAWVVCIPMGENKRLGVKHLKKHHPELYVKINDHGFMRPDKEGTANHIASICEEITRKYDIDGIHLDYIRYPEEGRLPGRDDDKRQNITRIVQRVNQAVKTCKPWVKMSCSPVGKYKDLMRYSSVGWNAYDLVYQDAQGWLRDGLMDMLMPMMYFRGNQFYPFAADWQEHAYGRIVVPGLGVYFMSKQEKNWPAETITREMYSLRQMNLGHAYFRSKFFTDNIKGIYDKTRNEIDKYPSLIPPMKWMNKKCPSSPKSITHSNKAGRNMLSWSGATNNNDSPYLTYNIYCSEDYPVDIRDARNLVAINVRATEIELPGSMTEIKNFAVTAVDRYGNESVPYGKRDMKVAQSLPFYKTDGSTLELPKRPDLLDAEFMIVKDMAGKTVCTLSWESGGKAQIRHLKNGMYQLCSLGRRGITHRFGFFQVQRESPF